MRIIPAVFAFSRRNREPGARQEFGKDIDRDAVARRAYQFHLERIARAAESDWANAERELWRQGMFSLTDEQIRPVAEKHCRSRLLRQARADWFNARGRLYWGGVNNPSDEQIRPVAEEIFQARKKYEQGEDWFRAEIVPCD